MFERLSDKSEEKVAVVYSGGLDSAVIIAACIAKGMDVHPIIIDDNSQEYINKIQPVVSKFLIHYGLMNKTTTIRFWEIEPLMQNDLLGFIPGWKVSLQLAVMAHCHALGINTIYMGYNTSNVDANTYPDEVPEAITMTRDLYNTIYRCNIQVVSPFVDLPKSQVVELGLTMGVPLQYTVSCADYMHYANIHCGDCPSCEKRIVAFSATGQRDPAPYFKKPRIMHFILNKPR